MTNDRALSAAQWKHDRANPFDTPEDEPKSPCCNAELSRKGRCYGCGRIYESESMIQIHKSETADTRTCDYANTNKATLLSSSRQHIGDVVKAMTFFVARLMQSAAEHDYDKLTEIDWFHADFVTGFKSTGWWDNHRRIHRHHLAQSDGVPENVNLLDILEYIADCVMAGMARAGSVTPLAMTPEMLTKAFENTVEMLRYQIQVVPKEDGE